jgi:hypothetical protein
MFLLGELAFRSGAPLSLLRSLLAFAILPELKSIALPEPTEYSDFEPNRPARADYLAALIKPSDTSIPRNAHSRLYHIPHHRSGHLERREREQWDDLIEMESGKLAEHLCKQWPAAEPSLEGFTTDGHIDVKVALAKVMPEWRRLHDNWQFEQHLRSLQNILDDARSAVTFYHEPFISEAGALDTLGSKLRLPDLFDMVTGGLAASTRAYYPLPQDPVLSTTSLLTMPKAQLHEEQNFENDQSLAEWDQDLRTFGLLVASRWQRGPPQAMNGNSAATTIAAAWLGNGNHQPASELHAIIDGLASSPSLARRSYALDLRSSLQALQSQAPDTSAATTPTYGYSLRLSSLEIEAAVNQLRSRLKRRRKQSTIRLYELGQYLPPMSVSSLLSLLGTRAGPDIGDAVRGALVELGQLVVLHQRKRRLNELHRKDDVKGWVAEFSNVGHTNWKACNHPEWLLLEIESSIRIRPEQVDVAKATISPESRSNAVLQMNMGQGLFFTSDSHAGRSLTIFSQAKRPASSLWQLLFSQTAKDFPGLLCRTPCCIRLPRSCTASSDFC